MPYTPSIQLSATDGIIWQHHWVFLTKVFLFVNLLIFIWECDPNCLLLGFPGATLSLWSHNLSCRSCQLNQRHLKSEVYYKYAVTNFWICMLALAEKYVCMYSYNKYYISFYPGVRQKTVRQMSTMDNPGTLPIFFYCNECPGVGTFFYCANFSCTKGHA